MAEATLSKTKLPPLARNVPAEHRLEYPACFRSFKGENLLLTIEGRKHQIVTDPKTGHVVQNVIPPVFAQFRLYVFMTYDRRVAQALIDHEKFGLKSDGAFFGVDSQSDTRFWQILGLVEKVPVTTMETKVKKSKGVVINIATAEEKTVRNLAEVTDFTEPLKEEKKGR